MSSLLLSDLNACSRDEFVAALGNVFEYSPWIAEQATLPRPFDGVQQLFDAMKAVVDQTVPELRLALIRGHPDLANKTQRAAGLTAESAFRPICTRCRTEEPELRSTEGGRWVACHLKAPPQQPGPAC
jgi:2-oxo-4-hydroxy-4-carboxy--5-ureidoimidazoline (OHCU) decarboxylase